MPDNSYLVARTGTSNTSPVDPDTRVMRFSNTDTYITPVSDLVTGTGTGITYINQLTTMTAFPSSNNFMLLQKPTGVAYCALWMVYSSTSDFEGWQPKFDPTTAAGASADIINSNFVLPTGVAIDNKTNVFIVDAEQDSVFKFNSKGALKNESFGRVKSEGRIKHPRGIAFYNKTIFLADDSTNCIFRYKLSTDF